MNLMFYLDNGEKFGRNVEAIMSPCLKLGNCAFHAFRISE